MARIQGGHLSIPFDPPRTRQDGESLMKSPIATMGAGRLVGHAHRWRSTVGSKSGFFRSPATPKATAAAPAAPAASPRAATAPATTGVASGNRTGIKAPTDPSLRPANATGAACSGVSRAEPGGPDGGSPRTRSSPTCSPRTSVPSWSMPGRFAAPTPSGPAPALVLELRKEYQLPAYILRLKDFPRNSNIRNIPSHRASGSRPGPARRS